MNQTNDPNADYKALVQRGYDRCSAAYDAAHQGDANPDLTLVTSRLRGKSSLENKSLGRAYISSRASHAFVGLQATKRMRYQ